MPRALRLPSLSPIPSFGSFPFLPGAALAFVLFSRILIRSSVPHRGHRRISGNLRPYCLLSRICSPSLHRHTRTHWVQALPPAQADPRQSRLVQLRCPVCARWHKHACTMLGDRAWFSGEGGSFRRFDLCLDRRGSAIMRARISPKMALIESHWVFRC